VQNHPVITTGFVVCFEAIIFRVMDYFLYHKLIGATDSKQELIGATDSTQELNDLVVVNRYQLPTSSFTTLVFLFVCQMTLSLFYIYSLNNNKKGWADSSGWRWFIGLLLCNLAGEDEIGYVFQFAFWLKLLHTKDPRMQKVPSMMFFFKIQDFKKEVRARMFMSMFVNMFTRRIILCTAPILLSVANDPIDSVKDCLAVFFINKLDDLHDHVRFVKALKQKKPMDKENSSCCLHSGNVPEGNDYEEVSESEEDVEEKIEKLEKRVKEDAEKIKAFDTRLQRLEEGA